MPIRRRIFDWLRDKGRKFNERRKEQRERDERTVSSPGTALCLATCKATYPTGSDDVSQEGCQYVVQGLGTFNNKQQWTFTGDSLPDTLMPSDYNVTDVGPDSSAPFNHTFVPANVQVSNGFLNLIVPGGQTPADDGTFFIKSGEVQTVADNILYASVRVNAILSPVPGTCHGNFFYKSDNQESDIEYLTNASSQANADFGFTSPPLALWLTNQDTIVESPSNPTDTQVPATSNATQAINEYRIDWIDGQTQFYLNGNLQTTFTTNVPSEAGAWIWNNWANGDPAWSTGPPDQDNIFRIQDITMYYNTTSDTGSC